MIFSTVQELNGKSAKVKVSLQNWSRTNLRVRYHLETFSKMPTSTFFDLTSCLVVASFSNGDFNRLDTNSLRMGAFINF